MREGRRCHSRWLKENKGIDLRVIRENNNEATKILKRNIAISGTLETDLNSEVLSRGLKRRGTGKTKQLSLQLGTQGTSRSFCRTSRQELGEQGRSREVKKHPQQPERPNGQAMLCSVSPVFPPVPLDLIPQISCPPY